MGAFPLKLLRPLPILKAWSPLYSPLPAPRKRSCRTGHKPGKKLSEG